MLLTDQESCEAPFLRLSGPDSTSSHHTNCSKPWRGWEGAAGWALRGSGPGSALPGPSSNGHSAAAAAASTPTHCLPHSQQRQEEASAQRKAAQEAGPPPLPAPSLPPRGSSGADAILKPPGLCPQAGSAGTVNRWIHKDIHVVSRPRAWQKKARLS